MRHTDALSRKALRAHEAMMGDAGSFLADIVLVVHFAFALFVVGGLVAVWIGAAAGWRWVRNFRFRVAHLAAILFVSGESITGVVCPLTDWEAALRGARAEKNFVAQWVHRVLYYDWPDWVFTALYLGFALLVAATWIAVRPGKKCGRRSVRNLCL